MSKPKVIAFYLPQYHPTPDNDKWWGKGFTEWTNVGKAKPLFRGHYQPKVPADLGYYDLRLPEVREAQSELAKEAGIYGFCYYHYWFAGKEQLELPLNEVLRLSKPDFPFMLCWANESWHKKFWDKDGKGSSKELLIEQTYPGEEDHIAHFYRLLPAFKDNRYIQIDGKPAFMIYKPLEFPKLKYFINLWNSLAKKEGLNGIFFIASIWNNINLDSIELFRKNGFNAINILNFFNSLKKKRSFINKTLNKIKHTVIKTSLKVSAKDILPEMFTEYDKMEYVYPTLVPNWDHSPRSGKNGWILLNTTPNLFKDQINKILELTKAKKNNYIFLKSWNEWGEGNYMEPDLKYGKGYINALRETLEKFENS